MVTIQHSRNTASSGEAGYARDDDRPDTPDQRPP